MTAYGRPPGFASELVYAQAMQRQIKMLGALPVIASFCRRLDISGVIDGLVPIRDVATISIGRAVEAMACNRLTSPAPLVHAGTGPATGRPGRSSASPRWR